MSRIERLEPRQMLSTARVAVIGDFGSAEQYTGQPATGDVAALVKSWDVPTAPLDAIITTGDNNYPLGEADTIDTNVGQYYSDYIGNYQGSYGPGSAVNRFFPSPGNHDWDSTDPLAPYLDYFTLPEGPGEERYYDFVIGPIHFFSIDSNPEEPHGHTSESAQANWLRERMEASDSPWQVVYFHHPPYSSGGHRATSEMRWPFAEWGADLVLSGHDHAYERLNVDGLHYIVNGSGGRSLYEFRTPLPESQVRYNADFGAQLIEATDTMLCARFFNSGTQAPRGRVDTLTLHRDVPSGATRTPFQQGVNDYTAMVSNVLQDGNLQQVLLRFDDLFGTGPGQVPPTAEIVSATLTAELPDSGGRWMLHRMLTEWDPSTTWDSISDGVQSDDADAMHRPDAAFSGTGTRSVTITSAVRGWRAAPQSNFGWALLPGDTNGADMEWIGDAQPMLVIDHTMGPAAAPEVSVAPVSHAIEGGQVGEWLFTREGDTSSRLSVSFSIGGTASPGADYEPVSETINIPAGAESAVFQVPVLNDGVFEGSETLRLGLLPTMAYRIGLSAVATLLVAERGAPLAKNAVSANESAHLSDSLTSWGPLVLPFKSDAPGRMLHLLNINTRDIQDEFRRAAVIR